MSFLIPKTPKPPPSFSPPLGGTAIEEAGSQRRQATRMRIGRRASTLLTDSSLAKPIGGGTGMREGERPAATQGPQAAAVEKEAGSQRRQAARTRKERRGSTILTGASLAKPIGEGTETREEGRPAATQGPQAAAVEKEAGSQRRQAARTRKERRGSTILTGASLAKPIGEGTETREGERPAATQGPQLAAVKKKKVRPPTLSPVIRDELFDELEFDPKGPTEGAVAFSNPKFLLEARKGKNLAKDAGKMTENLFPGVVLRNNPADAFRHALWGFLMTRELGPEMAKRFGDAHEISKPNPDGERLMDLYNNHMGRVLALDPKNKGRPAEDVIMEAIRNRQLQTRTFRVQGKPRP